MLAGVPSSRQWIFQAAVFRNGPQGRSRARALSSAGTADLKTWPAQAGSRLATGDAVSLTHSGEPRELGPVERLRPHPNRQHGVPADRRIDADVQAEPDHAAVPRVVLVIWKRADQGVLTSLRLSGGRQCDSRARSTGSSSAPGGLGHTASFNRRRIHAISFASWLGLRPSLG
jgi:hypothetical protein